MFFLEGQNGTITWLEDDSSLGAMYYSLGAMY